MGVITSVHQQVSEASARSETSDHDSCHGRRVTERADARPQQGLYDPALDKDSCGVGFVADIKGRCSHKIVTDALTVLLNL